MSRTFVFSICFLISWTIGAQELPAYSLNDYSVIPPSPEVSALMEYIDFPVSYHTGLPDITLPLYVVKEGTLEVPISISYHGCGAKVNRVAGILEQDWILNAGGCVARYVRGLPDEIKKGGTNGIHGLFSINNPDRINEKNLRNEFLGRDFDNIYNPIPPMPLTTSYILPYSMCSKFNEGRMDMASDIYQMNFFDKQGTFAINPIDRRVVLSSPSHLKAVTINIPELGGGCCFIDEMQNKYYFYQQEQSCFNYSYKYGGANLSDTIHYNSAWHLTKVISPQQDSIMFEYIYAGERIVSHGYSKSETVVSQTNSNNPAYTIYDYYPHSVQYYPWLLHKIKNRSSEIVFVYDNNHEKLIEIDVYRRSVPQELLKRLVINRESLLIGYSNINGVSNASY